MKNYNKQYNQKRYNRKRNISHWGLALQQIRQYPLMLVLFLPIVILAITIWVKMDVALTAFDVPEMLFTIYNIAIKIMAVLIPLLLLWVLIDITGSLTAHKDEAAVQMVFDEKELRNGSPILMYKRKDKKTGVYMREWYSPIPLKIWIEQQDRIEHHMREHLKKEFEYDYANDSRIVMYSAKGTKHVEEENPVYDMNLENDMEKYVK